MVRVLSGSMLAIAKNTLRRSDIRDPMLCHPYDLATAVCDCIFLSELEKNDGLNYNNKNYAFYIYVYIAERLLKIVSL